jgi:hypothetical protein
MPPRKKKQPVGAAADAGPSTSSPSEIEPPGSEPTSQPRKRRGASGRAQEMGDPPVPTEQAEERGGSKRRAKAGTPAGPPAQRLSRREHAQDAFGEDMYEAVVKVRAGRLATSSHVRVAMP